MEIFEEGQKSRSEIARGEVARKRKSGRAKAEKKVLGSGPLVLGKAKARAEEKVLGSGPLVLGKEKAGKAGNEFARG
ncbi:hypothetical protein EA25_16730 [Vibrio navarrensis]|nr:hypothetical protein EA25_16730 [Vibrio navarrensis]